MLAPLSRMQDLLQGIYDVRPGFAVGDFLVTDPEQARRLAPGARDNRERVLLLQEPGCLSLSLYLERELVQRLSDDDPTTRLHSGNLADCWIALEGLSHFLFLTWSASNDRQTSQIELETQAEVDKFIATLLLVDGQRCSASSTRAGALLDQLFADPRFDPALSGEERERYRGASRMAARYCRDLRQRFLERNDLRGLLAELRRFYRQAPRRKLSRLNRIL